MADVGKVSAFQCSKRLPEVDSSQVLWQTWKEGANGMNFALWESILMQVNILMKRGHCKLFNVPHPREL